MSIAINITVLPCKSGIILLDYSCSRNYCWTNQCSTVDCKTADWSAIRNNTRSYYDRFLKNDRGGVDAVQFCSIEDIWDCLLTSKTHRKSGAFFRYREDKWLFSGAFIAGGAAALASLSEGGGTPNGVTEGVSYQKNDTPPVRNQRFLTAPSERGPRRPAGAVAPTGRHIY